MRSVRSLNTDVREVLQVRYRYRRDGRGVHRPGTSSISSHIDFDSNHSYLPSPLLRLSHPRTRTLIDLPPTRTTGRLWLDERCRPLGSLQFRPRAYRSDMSGSSCRTDWCFVKFVEHYYFYWVGDGDGYGDGEFVWVCEVREYPLSSSLWGDFADIFRCMHLYSESPV